MEGEDPKLGPEGFPSYTQTLTLYYHPQAGPDFIRRFYGDAEVTLFRDRRQGTDWLAKGKFPICFFCRDIEAARSKVCQWICWDPSILKKQRV